MFSRTAAQQTRERTASTLRSAAEAWHSTATNWYDGTPRSIDARIAKCDRIIHLFREAGVGHREQLAELTEDRAILANLKASLLNAHQDREVAPARTAARSDYLIEARAFVRENIDAVAYPSEMRERAHRHADLRGDDAPAFAETCVRVAATVPVSRTASAIPTEVPDFADSFLFM